MSSTTDLLALINDTLQAVIVIFGAAVVLYNLESARQDRTLRTYNLVLSTVIIVYFSELLVSRTDTSVAALWLQLKWIGIAFMPAVQFHFSDAVLVSTGSFSGRRRMLIMFSYFVSAMFFLFVWGSDVVVVREAIALDHAIYLGAGPAFPLFTLFYWVVSVASIYNVWRAWQRAITRMTRRRLRTILLVIMAAPLSAFPYMAASNSQATTVPVWMWGLLIVGNLLVGLMFQQLTANIIYLGTMTSSRVVRVKLLKFMARVPMTASIVLLVYVLTIQTTGFFGLSPATAAALTVVSTVMIVEWAIHAYKHSLERTLHFNNEPDVRLIQELSERLITRQDMTQLLESLLAAGCDALRVPTAFVASIGPGGPRLTALIGSSAAFARTATDDLATLPSADELLNENAENARLRWHNYWVQPLYSRKGNMLVGVLGVGVSNEPTNDVSEEIINRIAIQAANALEDQLLQQSVFATLEGLLPTVTALQQLRNASTFSGAVLIQDNKVDTPPRSEILDDPNFRKLVKEALNHYWGGPRLTESPLLELRIVQSEASNFDGNPVKGLRAILEQAIERQKPDGEQSLTRTEWLLYNILELKFVKGNKVRDIARRLAMSESDLYRKQRVAIENVARAIADMELGRDVSADSPA